MLHTSPWIIKLILGSQILRFNTRISLLAGLQIDVMAKQFNNND